MSITRARKRRLGARWLDYARQVLAGVERHPLRALLILLTYLFGFASVTGTVATVEGGRRVLERDFARLGVDLIVVFPQSNVDLLALIGAQKRITHEQCTGLEALLGARAERVTPLAIDPILLEVPGARAMSATAIAAEAGFERALELGLVAGRFVTADEARTAIDAQAAGAASGAPPVPLPAVLDEALARRLDPNDPAALVGRELGITRGGKRQSVRVVGVLADPFSLRRQFDMFTSSGSSARSADARRLEFRNIYLPFRPGQDVITAAVVQAHDMESAEPIARDIEAWFGEFALPVYCFVQGQWIQRLLHTIERAQFISNFIWIVNLLVVVVLTATISLVAIEERYFEVALRRAEGASTAQVVLPLLTEGALLALAALAPAVGVAWLVLEHYFVPVLGWQPVLTVDIFMWLTPVLVGTGALANLLPAWRVARLDPARVLAATNME